MHPHHYRRLHRTGYGASPLGADAAKAVIDANIAPAHKIDILGVQVEAGPYFLDGAKGALVGGVAGLFVHSIGLAGGLAGGGVLGLTVHWLKARNEQLSHG